MRQIPDEVCCIILPCVVPPARICSGSTTCASLLSLIADKFWRTGVLLFPTPTSLRGAGLTLFCPPIYTSPLKVDVLCCSAGDIFIYPRYPCWSLERLDNLTIRKTTKSSFEPIPCLDEPFLDGVRHVSMVPNLLSLSIRVGSPVSLPTRTHRPSQGNNYAPIISGTNRIFYIIHILLRGSHN